MKPTGDFGPFHILTPRQRLNSLPYAVHGLTADQIAGYAATNFLRSDSTGRVAIGRETPSPNFQLEVAGPVILEPGGTGGGFLSFHTRNFETGMTINGGGTGRAEIRFDGKTLKLLANAGGGPPPAENGLTIATDGGVGIGTARATPGVRLEVAGTALFTPGGSGGDVQIGSPNAVKKTLGSNIAQSFFSGIHS